MGVLGVRGVMSAPVCECGGEGRNGHPTQEVVPYGQYQNSNARWTRHGPQGLLSIGRLAVLWYDEWECEALARPGCGPRKASCAERRLAVNHYRM